jgi:aerobic carbon-monoxide dehydrogenase medium subunit
MTRYVSPSDLDEAVRLLATESGARVLAGGHSLLLPAKRAGIAGAMLVDLRKVDELVGIELQPDGSLKIGAMTSIRAIAADEVIRTRYPALAEAAQVIGDAQVRNRATLGGSLADANPEADLPAVLLALDASIQIKGAQTRTVRADQFLTGARKTAIGRDEIITSAVLQPPPQRSGIAYERVKNPATLYALCGVAVSVALGQGQTLSSVRIAVTGALEYPARLHAWEQALSSKNGSDDSVNAALSSLPEALKFRADIFASSDYRQHLVKVLTRRALKRAMTYAA